jgi:SAM-dependent methyltransferase
MFAKEYWDVRAERYGHTGHSEPFLYCFDQEARKFAIDQVIRQTPFRKRQRALDFGCGSGDFLPLLKNNFGYVLGYDISGKVLEKAKRNFKGTAALTDDLDMVKEKGPYDLILTVTVLQGIENEEIGGAMKRLFSLLSDDGFVVSMEFFSKEGENTDSGETRLTQSGWKEILKANGLRVVFCRSFYNPVIFPSVSWKKYKANLPLKILRPFKHLSFVKSYFSWKARQIIYKERDILAPENSTFKIYILQKETHAGQTS